MADEQNEQQGSGGGLPIKSIIIIAAILLVEGGLMALWMMLDEPDTAAADTTIVEEQVVPTSSEMLIVENMRVPNNRTGKLMMYDIRVGIEAEESVATNLKDMTDKFKIRIEDSIYTIISQADPYLFTEPQRLTLKRQIQSSLEEYFGEGTIKRVLIPSLVGFRGE